MPNIQVTSETHRRVGKYAAEREISKKVAYDRVIKAVLNNNGNVKSGVNL